MKTTKVFFILILLSLTMSHIVAAGEKPTADNTISYPSISENILFDNQLQASMLLDLAEKNPEKVFYTIGYKATPYHQVTTYNKKEDTLSLMIYLGDEVESQEVLCGNVLERLRNAEARKSDGFDLKNDKMQQKGRSLYLISPDYKLQDVSELDKIYGKKAKLAAKTKRTKKWFGQKPPKKNKAAIKKKKPQKKPVKKKKKGKQKKRKKGKKGKKGLFSFTLPRLRLSIKDFKL